MSTKTTPRGDELDSWTLGDWQEEAIDSLVNEGGNPDAPSAGRVVLVQLGEVLQRARNDATQRCGAAMHITWFMSWPTGLDPATQRDEQPLLSQLSCDPLGARPC